MARIFRGTPVRGLICPYLALFNSLFIQVKLNKGYTYKLMMMGPLSRGPLEIPCDRRTLGDAHSHNI